MPENTNEVLAKIVGIVEDIRENMITRTEFTDFKSEIYSHIDGFVKLHETLDTELVSLRNKYDRLEERLSQVEQKVGIVK